MLLSYEILSIYKKVLIFTTNGSQIISLSTLLIWPTKDKFLAPRLTSFIIYHKINITHSDIDYIKKKKKNRKLVCREIIVCSCIMRIITWIKFLMLVSFVIVIRKCVGNLINGAIRE